MVVATPSHGIFAFCIQGIMLFGFKPAISHLLPGKYSVSVANLGSWEGRIQRVLLMCQSWCSQRRAVRGCERLGGGTVYWCPTHRALLCQIQTAENLIWYGRSAWRVQLGDITQIRSFYDRYSASNKGWAAAHWTVEGKESIQTK